MLQWLSNKGKGTYTVQCKTHKFNVLNRGLAEKANHKWIMAANRNLCDVNFNRIVHKFLDEQRKIY